MVFFSPARDPSNTFLHLFPIKAASTVSLTDFVTNAKLSLAAGTDKIMLAYFVSPHELQENRLNRYLGILSV